MALFPGAQILNGKVVAVQNAGQAIDFISQGVGYRTVTVATNTYVTGAAQTETVPALATRVKIEVVGPGGNGGAGNSANPGGAGGGGGGYSTITIGCVQNQTFIYTVGTAVGTDSTVAIPTGVLTGGSGTSGTSSAGGGTPVGVGGTASGGSTNTSGTSGNPGITGNAGTGGAAAAPLGGSGGTGGAGAGGAGVAPGGGGGGTGSLSSAAGGAGAAGTVKFTYFTDKVGIDTNAVSGNTFRDGFAINANGAMFGTASLVGTDTYEGGVRKSVSGALVFVFAPPTFFVNGNGLAGSEAFCFQ